MPLGVKMKLIKRKFTYDFVINFHILSHKAGLHDANNKNKFMIYF